MLTPVYALFITSIGGGVRIAGILFGIQYISVSLTSLLVMKLRDKTTPGVGMLGAGFLIRGVAWALLAAIPSIELLLILQVFIGAAEGIGSPAFLALASEHLDDNKHIREWGMWSLIANPIVAMASILSGFIAADLGFRAILAIMSAGSFVALAILLYYGRRMRLGR